MIKSEKPLSMGESLEYLKGENAGEIKSFIKKFSAIDEKQAKALREKHITKIIDVLPEDKESLNSLLGDANLDEDEINKIIDKIKTRE
jgi:DNA-directed RNA polymerase subunit F